MTLKDLKCNELEFKIGDTEFLSSVFGGNKMYWFPIIHKCSVLIIRLNDKYYVVKDRNNYGPKENNVERLFNYDDFRIIYDNGYKMLQYSASCANNEPDKIAKMANILFGVGEKIVYSCDRM